MEKVSRSSRFLEKGTDRRTGGGSFWSPSPRTCPDMGTWGGMGLTSHSPPPLLPPTGGVGGWGGVGWGWGPRCQHPGQHRKSPPKNRFSADWTASKGPGKRASPQNFALLGRRSYWTPETRPLKPQAEPSFVVGAVPGTPLPESASDSRVCSRDFPSRMLLPPAV